MGQGLPGHPFSFCVHVERVENFYVLENNGAKKFHLLLSYSSVGGVQLLSKQKTRSLCKTPMQIWKELKRLSTHISFFSFSGTTEPRMTSAARSAMAAEAAGGAAIGRAMHEDWGPGPPPPFRIPPPPLPHFMLPDDLEDLTSYCQTTTIDSPLAVCDTTFVSTIIQAWLKY